MQLPRFFTIADVACMISRSTATVRRYIDDGKLQTCTSPHTGAVLIPEKSVFDFIGYVPPQPEQNLTLPEMSIEDRINLARKELGQPPLKQRRKSA